MKIRSFIAIALLSLLSISCHTQDNDLLIMEKKVQKKGINTQEVATTMGKALEATARAVEKLGSMQKNLIYMLTDTITQGRRSLTAGQNKETRQKLNEKLQELAKQATALVATIEETLKIFSVVAVPQNQTHVKDTVY